MDKAQRQAIATGVIVALIGVVVSFSAPMVGIPICVLGIILAWWWGWGKDWLARLQAKPGDDPTEGYHKAEGVHWGLIGDETDFEIDTSDLEDLSGILFKTFALTSDRLRQPTKLLILCSDPLRKVSAKLDHVVIPGIPLEPETRGSLAISLEFDEYPFGPIPSHGLDGSPKAPFEQSIRLTVGFEMQPKDSSTRHQVLDVLER